MAPGNKDRHPGHTGTIPKTKVRNNCNVPQEAVTPTRRDMASNLVTTSLDWVPVSEYNPRSNCNQSRKQTNNTSDQELADLDNSVSFESGFGRFVPVRPQPRALPLTVQNRDHLSGEREHIPDDASSSGSHSLHPYAHQLQNGLIPHSNHAAAAVMIVNPTTPNTCAGNMSQSYNTPNQNRKNLTRNLNSNRNTFEGNNNSNNNTASASSNSRSGTKAVNLMNNMYDQGQGGFSNINENNHVHRESARALGEAIVAACPDAASVERRLGQIREYIRVTSSLVDTMRNSEDEAFIEHTKEEYDELIEMIMKLKESEKKLESLLLEKTSDTLDAMSDDKQQPNNNIDDNNNESEEHLDKSPDTDINTQDKPSNVKSPNEGNIPGNSNNHLKKVTNIENEQLNRTLSVNKNIDEASVGQPHINDNEDIAKPDQTGVEIKEIESIPCTECDNDDDRKDDATLNEILKKNIISCAEKMALIEEMKNMTKDANNNEEKAVQDVVVRPVSVQSNGSVYSENELWQNEIKNKMEMSQMRLSALKQQQKRLIKYQEEAKQQLEELNKERQNQEMHHASTSHDNFGGSQNLSVNANYIHPNRMYATNQIGVATTLPQTSDHQGHANNMDTDHGRSTHSAQSDDRYLMRDGNIACSEEAAGGGRDSEVEDDEGILHERGRMLQLKLRELQMKKQHMENLVTEFQKLQMATRIEPSHNTYSSSGEDSGEDEPSRKCNKQGVNLKNEDPFKLMEIKAIKTALQKTKDLMRSVETFEADHLCSVPDESFHMPSHSNNIHDNKSECDVSVGGWSEGSLCRVQNPLPHRHKLTNEHSAQRHAPQQIQGHEANINSLQELAQELRMETEKIMGERARIKDLVTNKVLETLRTDRYRSGDRNYRIIKYIICSIQVRSATTEAPKVKPDSRAASVANQSYTSEPEEPESRSEHIQMDSQNSRETENFRGGGDSALGSRSVNTAPSQLASAYCSDTDSVSRGKSNQRNRARRRPTQERHPEEHNIPQQNNVSARHEPRPEASNVNMTPPVTQSSEHIGNMPYPHLPPPCWNSKSNQDMRTNQFTQNSHSQTMERLLGTPQMSFPPTMPFNMMLPYGGMMCGGCACGCACGAWGAWCWQQLLLHQRDIHHLREQLAHLEERWRAETASHTLNNQVPPGNRANNYWDNFRSYSRQNLLSTNSKTNADGHLGAGPAPPHPLVERSHNTLHHTSSSTSPSVTPKRNTNAASSQSVAAPHQPHADDAPNRHSRRNVAYERSLSFSSAPDVLNVNQNNEEAVPTPRNLDESANANHRQEAAANAFRNLNITNPIPEIIQSHSNNLNATTNSKKKSSAKLPSKNSANRRNYNMLDFSQTSNINIASTSEASSPNPNLASTSREVQDKATSKLFDLLRESIYSEVTTLIGVNESHPDFLIQLFKELKYISSDQLRQKVLQSIRNILSQYSPVEENQNGDALQDDYNNEAVTTTSESATYHGCMMQNGCSSTVQIDNRIVRFLLLKSEEVFTQALLESLANIIVNNPADTRNIKKLLESLLKYEGMRVCDVSSDIIENLTVLMGTNHDGEESTHRNSEMSEPSILQDVAGSLNLFRSSETQLHQINGCPYDMWPGHVHMEIDSNDINDNNQERKSDLISCSEMHNGDLAEADQTCHSDVGDNVSRENDDGGNAEALPDVVDTEEVTPTEAEAEWLGLDRVPTRLHMEELSEK
ncbi:pericentriolar material 1 protein [Zerene cesonia]|uniref:pericentriolar material 1 protein n=1 Tax=Zerene cesonia TaxID=33412 RepID=UPI0018E50890|nr:pericentriolar material 1 protein [Zerene cesonia]